MNANVLIPPPLPLTTEQQAIAEAAKLFRRCRPQLDRTGYTYAGIAAWLARYAPDEQDVQR